MDYTNVQGNKVFIPETKIVQYDNTYARFVEEDVDDGVVVGGTFKLTNAMSARVIRQDKYTIVILEDGSKGISECGEGEAFSRKKGLRIAFNRALIKHLERETEKLCWS